MNEQEIREKIAEAKRLVGGQPEDPFTQIAFAEVFRLLLRGEEAAGMTKREMPAVQKMQLSEFLASLNMKTQFDNLVAIAYYNLHARSASLTRAEALEGFARARLPRPSNLSDVIGQAIRRGYLVEAAEKKEGQKAWSITPTGERYIEERVQLTQQ